MAQEKQGWDTRAWLVGILGGLAGGGIMAWANTPAGARHVNATVHFANALSWVMGVTAFLTALVLPGILSGIAHRRTFLWGLLPLSLFLAVLDTESRIVYAMSPTAKDYGQILLVIWGCLLVSSGPVSLIRYTRACARWKREAALAAVAAQREAVSIPQDGVWPPPPDYRENNLP